MQKIILFEKILDTLHYNNINQSIIMEVKGGHDRKFTVAIFEMLGTALFIYGIIMTSTAATIPFSLFAILHGICKLSGARFEQNRFHYLFLISIFSILFLIPNF